MHDIREIFEFWFSEGTRTQWFAPTPAFDQDIRKRFAERFTQAAAGELRGWEESPEGCVALCILLDQMPRNMFRGRPHAFATDAQALVIAERAVSRGFDRGVPPEHRQFLYLPFLHSEELAHQLRAAALFESVGSGEALAYVKDHLAIIRRFGRFPHRNAILGRTSTPQELEFLARHGHHYGQRAEHARDEPHDPELPDCGADPAIGG